MPETINTMLSLINLFSRFKQLDSISSISALFLLPSPNRTQGTCGTFLLIYVQSRRWNCCIKRSHWTGTRSQPTQALQEEIIEKGKHKRKLRTGINYQMAKFTGRQGLRVAFAPVDADLHQHAPGESSWDWRQEFQIRQQGVSI